MHYITDVEKMEDYKSRYKPENFFSFDISPYMKLAVFEENDLILKDHILPDTLFYLVEGSAKLYLPHQNGRISLINFFYAPCFLGEMELIGAQEHANIVKATSHCVCFAIETRSVKEKMLQDSVFLRYLCQFLASKAIVNTSIYSNNQSYPLENRLAQYILQTEHNGLYTEKHTEASEFLGVTYRHFLYVVADFVKKGLLIKTAAGYRIVDRARLEEHAKR